MLIDDSMQFVPRPTRDRPLLGQTVLVVEDSRFAGEALRLICLRSGARIRRADSLRSAARHLTTYRPTIVIVDLGLPDGSGLSLLSDLAAARPRVPAILAISGDDTLAGRATEAGADGFLEKPFGTLSQVQAELIRLLPQDMQLREPRLVVEEPISPDRAALQDDLSLAASLLDAGTDDPTLSYAAGFVRGLGLCSGDPLLVTAAQDFMRQTDHAAAPQRAMLAGMVQERLGRLSKTPLSA
ncbi:response regulator [Mesobaculum littorinae]|uniref:Response regulator n=1 Tax=Mesobaculum littorinae TaxID=2486419 RepID=A0A438AKP7_9RHOB|nr:response regulator [Mesobaculum littorinae]RVV99157.1 response regulator [Mesobaculum littorinae]